MVRIATVTLVACTYILLFLSPLRLFVCVGCAAISCRMTETNY